MVDVFIATLFCSFNLSLVSDAGRSYQAPEMHGSDSYDAWADQRWSSY